MRYVINKETFAERQLQILNLLFEKDYIQNELEQTLEISAPNLHYHLKRLEDVDLVRKETLYKIGNAKCNRISLNPTARQLIRRILGKKIKHYTLITGYGELKTGYRVPDLVYKILRKYKFSITRIICFTTPEAMKKRDDHLENEELLEIDKQIQFPYNEYRYIESNFFNTVESIISEEMKNANIIIDLTPLSKLFSLKLLELSNKYEIPCIYLGKDADEKEKLYSMTNMKIKSEIKSFF